MAPMTTDSVEFTDALQRAKERAGCAHQLKIVNVPPLLGRAPQIRFEHEGGASLGVITFDDDPPTPDAETFIAQFQTALALACPLRSNQPEGD